MSHVCLSVNNLLEELIEGKGPSPRVCRTIQRLLKQRKSARRAFTVCLPISASGKWLHQPCLPIWCGWCYCQLCWHRNPPSLPFIMDWKPKDLLELYSLLVLDSDCWGLLPCEQSGYQVLNFCTVKKANTGYTVTTMQIKYTS